MAAGKYSFTVEQGTTYQFDIVYRDSTESIVDLSGYSAKMQIRPDFADFTDESYITLSSSLDSDGSGLILDGVSGSITVLMSATKTTDFNFDEGLYDLEIYSGNVVTRLLEGKVKVRREVTR
jgi:hypothetical protein